MPTLFQLAEKTFAGQLLLQDANGFLKIAPDFNFATIFHEIHLSFNGLTMG